jgi:hypothetical protein
LYGELFVLEEDPFAAFDKKLNDDFLSSMKPDGSLFLELQWTVTAWFPGIAHLLCS